MRLHNVHYCIIQKVKIKSSKGSKFYEKSWNYIVRFPSAPIALNAYKVWLNCMHRFKKRCAYKIHYRIQQRARGDPRKNHGIGMGLQYANLHSVSLLNPMQQFKRNIAYIYQQNISKFCKDLHLSIILPTDISKVDRENS